MHSFDNIEPIRSFTYGGRSGSKLAFEWNKEIWFLKFPQNIKEQNFRLSYSFSPISEYIGSMIYQHLGIPTHETKLGVYQGKTVVACKDFNQKADQVFYEFKGLFNNPLKGESNEFSDDEYDLNIIMETIDSNFNKANSTTVKEHFWRMFVIDAFINNQDRNNGNWGYLVDRKGKFISVSPVYDNGGSFFPKSTTEALLKKEFLQSRVYNGRTPFSLNSKRIDSISVLRKAPNLLACPLLDTYIKNALQEMLPKIKLAMPAISQIINDIPNEYASNAIISPERKKFYQVFLAKRLELVFEPALKRIIEIQKSPTIHISKPTGKGIER